MGSQDDPRVKFGLSCPDGGEFYVCQDSSTQFIGCCGEDPCTSTQDGTCPENKLYNATFSAASGVNFLEQSCADSPEDALWYTCSDANPPFLGCCKNNPCNNGCEDGNLVAAVLSDDPKNASQFLLPETTTTTSSSSASPTSTNTSSASPTNSDTSKSGSEKSSAGLIVGLSLAGVVILLIVLGVYLWSRRREQARLKREREERLEEEQSKRLNEPQGLFTEDVTRPSTNPTSPPVNQSAFSANTSIRTSQDPETSPGFSPSTNPHISQVSELEGSATTMRAMYPDSPEAYRGFNGREGQYWR
ncbi:hypothetical protein GGR57DRAFT_516637 [Xylariaceae sp. FL1272]|nr:hypothetical protein GGR57DRAFT_516637 [Xylariaceae sp. FL1272]